MWRNGLKIYCILLLLNGCVTKVINSDGTTQNTTVDKVKLADTYIDLAIAYQQHGAPQVALDRANLAIKTNSNSPKAYMIRAMIDQQLGQTDDAEQDFKQAINLDKNYPEAYVNYAVFLCDQKRYSEAMANFNRALTNPLYYTPEIGLYSRGNCYFQQQQLESANRDYLNALNYKNPPADVFIALAKLHLTNNNYGLANYYINLYTGNQTASSLWLHIQILQGLIKQTNNSTKIREYSSYSNTLGQLLIKNYANSPEAQQYLTKYNNSSVSNSKLINNRSKNDLVLNESTISFANPKTTQSGEVKVAPSTSPNTTLSNNLAEHKRDYKIKTEHGRRYIIIQAGDTLYSISRKYAIPVTELQKINHLGNQGALKGMKLFLDSHSSN